jgi:putative ABC transport system permease protein
MIDADAFQEIVQSLSRHKLRTALTALGVFLGIFIFVLMAGLGPALEGAVRKRMAGFASNSVFMWGQRTSQPYAGMPPNRPVSFKNADIPTLQKLDGIEYLAPRNQLGGFRSGAVVARKGKTGSFQVAGDYPDFQYIQFPVMRAGRYINDQDIVDRRKIAVIGEEVARQLFTPDEEPIGGAIEVNGIHFEVVGVFGTRATGNQADQNLRMVHIPFTSFQQAFHFGDNVSWFAMTAKPGVNGAELEARARLALSERHKIAPDDEMAIGAWNAAKQWEKQSKLFWAIKLVLTVAGFLSLLAGAIGVAAILLITVRERTKEIGVRKALGASPTSVVVMVMAEAVMLTATAGYLGMVAGVAMIELANWLIAKTNSPLGEMAVSLEFAVAATLILIVVGALAGLIPALRAAAIQPIEALRDE